MGRLSQFFWALHAKNFPTELEQRFYYTSIDLSGKTGELVKKLRREIAKEKRKKEKEDAKRNKGTKIPNKDEG